MIATVCFQREECCECERAIKAQCSMRKIELRNLKQTTIGDRRSEASEDYCYLVPVPYRLSSSHRTAQRTTHKAQGTRHSRRQTSDVSFTKHQSRARARLRYKVLYLLWSECLLMLNVDVSYYMKFGAAWPTRSFALSRAVVPTGDCLLYTK